MALQSFGSWKRYSCRRDTSKYGKKAMACQPSGHWVCIKIVGSRNTAFHYVPRIKIFLDKNQSLSLGIQCISSTRVRLIYLR